MKFSSSLELIGNTPLLNITSFFPYAQLHDINIWIKLERFNLGGSIKDRVALNMIQKALENRTINHNTHIIEPTSGNTGIGLAIVCANYGLKLTLVMPESMSIERRILAQAYGAQLELTPAAKGMQGAINRAQEMSSQISNSWIPQQFNNSDNPQSHRSTADEIISDLPQLDYFISAVGTGGNISGCGKYLRQHFPQLQIYAVEPASSAVLNGKQTGAHKIQGIGAGFIPQNLDQKLLTGTITVSDQDAFTMTQQFTKETGVLVGISTGAVLQAIKQQLPHIKDNSTLLTINYDTGERYLSVDNLFT
jgi:cysteine synthase A